MSKTFRAEQTREKRRRPQSKKSKRGFKNNLNQENYQEIADNHLLKERV
ncbi:hypothetical protein [Marinifilum caeruleilacunae]|jgi:hypothetical protein|nr:hypothetical protein [Marinifilum caeruleilacunae]